MIDLASFTNVELHGGFVIANIQFASGAMVDALEREAVAQTRITGLKFEVLLKAEMSEQELSISLYHEILEAATVATRHPPDGVAGFNEGDFERAAQSAHAELGSASPENLNRMLQSRGFSRRIEHG
jgi:hypothetical protein